MAILTDLRGTTNSTFSIAAKPAVWVPVRQTVLTGRVDTTASNRPGNALSAGSGLSLTLNADSSSNAFRIAFADGWDSNVGAINYIGQYTSNQSLTLAANSTNFVYVNRNTSTGALSLGYSTLAPVYDVVAPSSASTDQHWFDLSEFRMKRWSGSVWAYFQRVFIGEVVTGASTISSTITYAYQGTYRSAWTAVDSSVAINYSFSHNLGMYLSEANAIVNYYGRNGSSDKGHIIDYYTYDLGSLSYSSGMRTAQVGTNNQRNILFGQIGVYFYYDGYQFCSAGDTKVIVKRGW